jgi:hypothetical protein
MKIAHWIQAIQNSSLDSGYPRRSPTDHSSTQGNRVRNDKRLKQQELSEAVLEIRKTFEK